MGCALAIPLVTVAGKITAAATNAEIVVTNAQGLTSIIPTSVAGTGVSLGAAGKVTLTAATAASINVCFTTAFDNYLFVIDVTHSTSAALTAKLRAAGVDSAASLYEQILAHFVTSAVTVSTSSANASFNVQGIGALQTIAELRIAQPALSAVTYLKADATAMTSATVPAKATYDGSYNATTVFDGITFTAGAGTLTGTIRIYGYNNG